MSVHPQLPVQTQIKPDAAPEGCRNQREKEGLRVGGGKEMLYRGGDSCVRRW